MKIILDDPYILYIDILRQSEEMADIHAVYFEATLVGYDEETVAKIGQTREGYKAVYLTSTDDGYDIDQILEFFDRCKESLEENIAVLEELLGHCDD